MRIDLSGTAEDVTMSIQREMVNLLQQDLPEVDQSSESITDQTNEVHEQPPPHREEKKNHPLKKHLGDK